MQVINTLAPIFAIIVLGGILANTKFLAEEFFRGMTKLVYWVGVPCLLFVKIAEADFAGGAALRIALVYIAGASGVVILSYGAGRLLGLKPPAMAAFAQAAFRSNLAFVGLPVIYYATDGDATVMTMAALTLAPCVLFNNILCVILLERHRDDPQAGSKLRRIVMQMLKNPLILAMLLALPLSAAAIPLPSALGRTMTALGQMSLPLALLGIGASLKLDRVRGHLAPAVTAALFKTAVAPLAGFGVCLLLIHFGSGWACSSTETMIALVYLACPTAVISYVLAQQLDADTDLAGSAVILATLLSIPGIGIVLACLGPV